MLVDILNLKYFAPLVITELDSDMISVCEFVIELNVLDWNSINMYEYENSNLKTKNNSLQVLL